MAGINQGNAEVLFAAFSANQPFFASLRRFLQLIQGWSHRSVDEEIGSRFEQAGNFVEG